MTGFITEWTVSGDATARTITLPLYNSGTFNCTVDWGDSSPTSAITTYNDSDRVHTYSTNGTYQVTITGECPAWSFNNTGDKLKCTDIINWGTAGDFGGFQYLTGGFYGCTALKTTGVSGKILSKSGLTTLTSLFQGCTTLTAITTGLFDNCTYLTTSGFYYTFASCSSITSIPTDLFKYNTSVSTTGFQGTFLSCTGITSVPTDLFRYNTSVSSGAFYQTFMSCTSLASIPTDLFRYNTSVSSDGFFKTFEYCYALTTVPTDTFKYNVSVSTRGFSETFYGDYSLATVPELLFKYNTSCTDFSSCFQNCIKLQQNAKIFYDTGEQSTRFSGKTVNFTDCFNIIKFTGTQGTAPDLWNCTFTSSTKTRCWGGNGNNVTSLSNATSVPSTWGHNMGFMIKVTVSGDAAARTITAPFYNSGTFNGTIDWGDGTATSAITSWNDADRVHVYASNGTYLINFYGEIPAWENYNYAESERLKIVDIVQWGRSPDHGGFQYLSNGFYGCTNLVSTGVGKILSKSTLYNVYNLFYNCTTLTAITSGMFDNCTYVTTNAYSGTFLGCTGITSIPSDLFKYSTAAAGTGFYTTFQGCTSITTIPADLFKYNTSLGTSGFARTFLGCTGLTTIPVDLFRYNTSLTTIAFAMIFSGCTSLSSIPTDLFKYNTGVTTSAFENAFYVCSSLTSIPTDLFRYNTSATTTAFGGTFYGCSSLTSIPTDLFRYNTSVSTYGFQYTFYNCSSLTTVPTDTFRYNTAVSTDGFQYTFYGCTSLATVPNNLFKYNTNCVNYTSTFENCNKLQQNAYTFYAAGEQSTRFSGKTVNFTNCFKRNTFTGTQGTAPDLWNCTMTASTKTGCWSGNGNNMASLSNATDVPSTWGMNLGFMIKVTVGSGDKTFTAPFYDWGLFNGTIDWGDGTATSAITSWNDADRSHTYTNAGTYYVNFYGDLPSWSFNNSGDKLKVVDIVQWGRSPDLTGFDYIINGFYGCTNIVSTGLGKIVFHVLKVDEPNVSHLFKNCTSLTSITSGLFDNGTALYDSAFKGTFYGCSGLTSIPSDIFKYNVEVGPSNAFEETFYGCTSLTSISADLFKFKTSVGNNSFKNTFKNCTGLTSIPTGLFTDGNPGGWDYGFIGTFEGCTSLTSIGSGLFDNSIVHDNAFLYTFKNCTSLSSIPTDLFRYVTSVRYNAFEETFYGCTSLTSIPSDTFKYNTSVSVSGFKVTFYGCSGITSIPTDLFRYNTSLSTSGFYNTFYGCTSLTTVPTDTFRYNTAVSSNGFDYTFYNCTNLSTIPDYLFRYNTSCTSFISTFENCNKLQQNSKTFYVDGNQSTRFAGQTLNFTNCFNRNTFTGTQGTAPDLWNCTYGSVTKTNCFAGSGNSLTSLTNYNSIPISWGGTYSDCFKLQFTVSGNVTARTITLPLINSGTFNCTVNWGDGTDESVITAYNDSDRIHTYSTDGTYTVYIFGACPSFSFNNGGDKLKLTGISSLSGDGFEGFEYLNAAFYGCTNLSSLGTSTIKAKASLTNLGVLFANCTSLTTIPTDLFRYSTNITTFDSCFYGCTSLTTVPTDTFRYNTAVTTFDNCFYSCTNLATVPELLFKYNTSCTSFISTFEGCTKLQQNVKIFYNTGEETTRFAGKTIDFTKCFYRTSFTGSIGTAPELWNCTFGSVTKTQCWSGAGNSLTSLTNYDVIPIPWGGPYVGCIRLQFTVSGDETSRTITLPLINSGIFNCTVTWGDGTPDSTITSYNDADRVHTYSADGTYEVYIFGACPSFSFNNSGDKLKLTGVLSLSGSEFEGFEYLTSAFYGCTNLSSLGTSTIKAKAALTTVAEMFKNCTSLTTIPSGLFDTATNLEHNGFYSTFEGCTSLTTIPSDLFKFNTLVSTDAFNSTFKNCTSLSSIPSDTFRYNTAVSSNGFEFVFYN